MLAEVTTPMQASSPTPAPGPFAWKAAPTPTDPDAIRILGHWAEINITSFACEPLARWTNGKSRIVTMNFQCKEDFLALWAELEALGLLSLIPTHLRAWNGSWVARYKRGLTLAQHDQQLRHLSNHSTGHAFDVCAAHLPRGKKAPADDPIHQWVPVCAKHNYSWGNEFATPDPMHFQAIYSPFP